jgi:predicted secreted protein
MSLRVLTSALVVATVAAAAAGATILAAPTAITGTVSSIGGSTVTVNGTVNPNGLATTWQFEYGATTGYGSKAPSTAPSAGSGTTNQAVQATISGLTPGTTYHYRLTATSSGGTTVGLDGIFTTEAAPGVVTGAASNTTPTQATVACSIDPHGLATTWSVEYGETTNYGTQTSGQAAGSGTGATSVSTTLTGLQGGKTYHYRCTATSSAGTTRGTDATFVPAGAPTVTTTAASSVAATTANLNGTVNPNGRATTVYFEYGTSTSYGSKTSSVSAGGGTSNVAVSRSVSGLKAATTYHFRVVATSDAGTARGSDLSFTTGGAPIVTAGSVAQIGPTSATVGGAVNPGGHSTTWYVEYGTTTSYGSKTSAANAGAGTANVPVSVTLTGLTPGTLYHYRIVAANSIGTTRGADSALTTIAPPAVTTGRVPVGDLSPTSATVTGSVNSHGLTAVAWFEYGPTKAYGLRTADIQIAAGITDQAVSAQLNGLTPSTRYHFRLVAKTAAGTTDGADKSFPTRASTVTVGAKANGTTVVLRAGQTLVVRLAGNPTTGYRWFAAHVPSALHLASAKYVAPPPGRLGQGGTYVFRFTVRTGNGSLRLEYRRAFEKVKPAIRTFTLAIRAR